MLEDEGSCCSREIAALPFDQGPYSPSPRSRFLCPKCGKRWEWKAAGQGGNVYGREDFIGEYVHMKPLN